MQHVKEKTEKRSRVSFVGSPQLRMKFHPHFFLVSSSCFCNKKTSVSAPKRDLIFRRAYLRIFIKILLKDGGNRLFFTSIILVKNIRVLPVLLEQGGAGRRQPKKGPPFSRISGMLRIPGTLFCEVGPVRDTALGRFSVYFCLMMW